MSLRAIRDSDTFNDGSRGVQAFRYTKRRRETVFQPFRITLYTAFE